MSQWRNPPPVVILSGTESFLRLRELNNAVSAADASGRAVEYLPSSDTEAISALISGSGVLFKQKYLVVLSDPQEISSDLVIKHFNRKSNQVVLLIHCEGTLPKAKCGLSRVVEALPKKFVARFESPKPWEREDQALQFVNQEAQRYDLKITSSLASLLVSQSSPDLGVLSFELKKLSWLMDAERREFREVCEQDIKGLISSFHEEGPKPILDALELKNTEAVAQALHAMKSTHLGQLNSATIRACGFVISAVTNWLLVASSVAQGQDPDTIAKRLGIHVFVVKKTLIPVSQRWGEDTLVSLIKSISRVDREAKSGVSNSWALFEKTLLHHLT